MKRIATWILDVLTWSWGLSTLYPVARYGAAVVVDPSTTSRIMAVRTGGHVDSAVGLTYTGLAGAVLVIVEVGLVAAALVLSAGGRTWLRRLSHVVLLAWTLLWLGNSIWMEQLSGGRHATSTSLVVVAVVVVLARAVMRWGHSHFLTQRQHSTHSS